MLPVVIFCHGIYDRIHFEVFFFLALFMGFAFFSFLFTFVSLYVHPSPAIHRLTTNVNEALKLLPA